MKECIYRAKGKKSSEEIAADITGKCKYCLPDYSSIEKRGEESSAEYDTLKRRAKEELKKFAKRTSTKCKKTLKEIEVTGIEGRIKYTFPIPPDNHEEEGLGVLPIVRYSGR